MPFYVRFPGTVTSEAHLRIDHRDRWLDRKNDLRGERVWASLEPIDSRQGHGAMRFYRGCVIPLIAEAMGEEDYDLVHEFVAWKFLRLDDDPVTGEPRRLHTDKRSMSREDFADYLERVLVWGSTFFGLEFPDPGAVAYRYEIPEAA